MNIGGLQKTSLLDYPDKISAIIWTIGCNFRCPFCYNTNLVIGTAKKIPEKEILAFLNKRKGLIEAVVISGGEPLMQNDIEHFLEKIKKLGYAIKVDTNGTYPNVLQKLLEKKLIDYVSMDVKAPKNKYSRLSGVTTDISKIEKSIEVIKKFAPHYEFKTTFIPTLLHQKDIIEIAKWLENAENYYLQKFKDDVPVISSELEEVKPYTKQYLEKTIEKVKPYFKQCDIRGV